MTGDTRGLLGTGKPLIRAANQQIDICHFETAGELACRWTLPAPFSLPSPRAMSMPSLFPQRLWHPSFTVLIKGLSTSREASSFFLLFPYGLDQSQPKNDRIHFVFCVHQ